MKTNSVAIAVRIRPTNPGHHLWDNHGTWWTHFTVHFPDFTKGRIRRSLGTRDIQEARLRRDALFATFQSTASISM